MQNTLERLFEGMQETLRTVVAPTLTDPYIASQVASVAEIIGNLSTRVELRSDQAREVVDRVRPILRRAADSGADLPLTRSLLARPDPLASAPNAELVAARDEHLAALREVQRGGYDDAQLREFLAWQVATEATLLRSGMFSRPSTEGERR